ncbi:MULTISPECIES: YjbF family lipoprotein [unclassified Marinovum]|uniref:YjbF family lipoprotein n=1 Tax=Roseobacteraceae TaxID=2854170 RepID=UPI001FD422ED|nr:MULTISPECIES: YjbF family lipoprotein [unclassified Marinovum]MCJ7871002.1 YjbF family lipoprotein [Phaeobacter sp. J2-8]
MKQKIRRSGFAPVAALCATALLAACSGGGEGRDGPELIRNAVVERFGPNGRGPVRVTPAQVQQLTARATNALILIDFPKTQSNAVLVRIGQNRSVETYATAARQTLSMENGLLRGTRGMGGDLMSADLGRLPQLIARRQSGSTQREVRILNGEDITVRQQFSCDVAVTGTGGAPRVTTMTENCTQQNGNIRFTNTYDVDGQGRVVSSDQWASNYLGQVKIQQLRF